MGAFGPGVLVDPGPHRGVAGKVVHVLDPDTGAPLQAYTPDEQTPVTVTTNSFGYYGQFTVPTHDRVLVRAGAVEENLAALTAEPPTVTSSGGVLTFDTGGS